MTKTEKNDAMEGAFAAAGFAIVLVVVGLPVWWQTTTVYRAALPCTQIDELASQFQYHTISINIIEETLSKYTDKFIDLDNSKAEIRYLVSGRRFTEKEKSMIKTSPSLEDLENNLEAENQKILDRIKIYLLPEAHDLMGSAEFIVGKQRTVFTKASIDQEKLWKLIHSMSVDPLAKVQFNDNYMSAFKEGAKISRTALMRQVPTEPGYDIILTLMLPEPHNVLAKWDPETAVQDYLAPLIEQIKEVANLNVRSQVLYMTSLNVHPKWDETESHYILPEDQLSLTINAIESKLGSYVSTRTSLNFIIYVPGRDQSPLQVYNNNHEPVLPNSFLVPRWGGVMIHNPPLPGNDSSIPRVFNLDTHWIMTTTLTHLHKLLPIPFVTEQHLQTRILPSKSSKIFDWQVDALSRARVSDYLNNIKTTLQSLCELVDKIDNMVVSDEVAASVWAATDLWQDCRDAAREGRLNEANKYCKMAFIRADQAFFHPTMLALLYFPDNQKYAIYVPLFLPVSIPVVLSLKMIYKLWKDKPTKKKSD